MRHNFVYENVSHALPALLRRLEDAPIVGSRAGRTRELTHVGITLRDPLAREVLVPGRKCNIAAQIAETAWMLAGRDDIEWLARYLPRARDYSDDGETWRGAYGTRLRMWYGADQLKHVVETLKQDSGSRQAVAVLYDPLVDHAPGKDIPCNNWLSFLLRDGELDLHVAVRSNDVMWGWSGINVFEWSVLLEVTAGLLGAEVGELHFSTTSFHLYERHWDKARRVVDESSKFGQASVDLPSPRFQLEGGLATFDDLLFRWFEIERDIRTTDSRVWRGKIANFPEPMLRSWLQVLDLWWNSAGLPTSLKGTALGAACEMGVEPAWRREMPEPEPATRVISPFLAHAIKLHNEKHAAYGDSWKRRGEMLGILANIARKVDRLGGTATSDETSADTALDLMVYLAKYGVWLETRENGEPHDFDASDTPDAANRLLVSTERFVNDSGWIPRPRADAEEFLRVQFIALETAVVNQSKFRRQIVNDMLYEANALARDLWKEEKAAADEYRGADGD